jgi:hypothetical protein
MLGMKTYSRDYIAACRARVEVIYKCKRGERL